MAKKTTKSEANTNETTAATAVADQPTKPKGKKAVAADDVQPVGTAPPHQL